MSFDYVWVCDGKRERVLPENLPGCTGHSTSMLRGQTATVLAWLISREGRWSGEAVRLDDDDGEGPEDYDDVTIDVARAMGAPIVSARLDKLRFGAPQESEATRLAVALKQNEDDALAMLEKVELASNWLPEPMTMFLREKCEDIRRMDRRALLDEHQYVQEVKARANREDILRVSIADRIGQVEALRVILSTLTGQPMPGPFASERAERDARAAAEAIASRWFRLSSAEWRGVVDFCSLAAGARHLREQAVFGRALPPPKAPPPAPSAPAAAPPHDDAPPSAPPTGAAKKAPATKGKGPAGKAPSKATKAASQAVAPGRASRPKAGRGEAKR